MFRFIFWWYCFHILIPLMKARIFGTELVWWSLLCFLYERLEKRSLQVPRCGINILFQNVLPDQLSSDKDSKCQTNCTGTIGFLVIFLRMLALQDGLISQGYERFITSLYAQIPRQQPDGRRLQVCSRISETLNGISNFVHWWPTLSIQICKECTKND